MLILRCPTIAMVLACLSGALPTVSVHFSEANGDAVRMQPSGASLKIPTGWAQEYGAVNLSPAQLRRVRTGRGEWYREYAKVANAALSFSDCSLAAGEHAWDGPSISLQMRGYVTRSNVDDVEREISTKGLAAARGLPKKNANNASVKESESGPWHRSLIHYDASYGDYGGKTSLDFYASAHEGWTVVLVFMHPDSAKYDPTVEEILNSFSWH